MSFRSMPGLLILQPDDGAATTVEPGVVGNRRHGRAVGEGAFDDHDAAEEAGIPFGGKGRVWRENGVEILVHAFQVVEERAVAQGHAAGVGGDLGAGLDALDLHRQDQGDGVAGLPVPVMAA